MVSLAGNRVAFIILGVRVVAYLLAFITGLVILGPGALAPAKPLVLETVEVRRVRYGWGLDSFAGVGVVRVAVEDCGLLGRRGKLLVEGRDVFDCYVVDCQQKEHMPLSELGIVADVSRAELGHKKAVIVLP